MSKITCDCWAITSAVAGATEDGMPGAIGGPGPINPGKPQSIDLSIKSKVNNSSIKTLGTREIIHIEENLKSNSRLFFIVSRFVSVFICRLFATRAND
jgi:hypothetical protein